MEVAAHCADGGDCKSGLDIESKPLLAFFAFCSVEVPSYIFPHKMRNSAPFLNSLPACRNL